MGETLRLACVALYGVGPLVALAALVRRGLWPPAPVDRVTGWRAYVPVVLLPVEWGLPPVLIALGVGEVPADWPAVRWAGFAVGAGGAALLAWAAAVLGRFLTHDAAVRRDHVLVQAGPYRLVRHPIYTGYLALLLGTAIAMLNGWLLAFWPVALAGILVQAAAEERVLAGRFGSDYERYAGRTGRLVPRLRR